MCNLASRHVPVEILCPFGKMEPETTLHDLWVCRDLKSLRSDLNLFELPFDQANIHLLDFLFLCRSLLYQNKFESFLAEFQQVKKVVSAHRPLVVVRWSPPRQGYFKVNTNAAMAPDVASVGLGIVIRDSSDLLVAAGTMRVRGHFSAHSLTKLAVKANGELVWLEDVSPSIAPLISEDASLLV
ncbi:hypothetical protein JRO89_XS15G0140500 [Xanthoceras sorbifolium]|uniref:Uncharacterized protein n=1 Tax=Xanthoceras sorbifolium TaxID=99658 RepID=A0ABQ8H243_9ROSI|nr:hypothetical protein JRO89_XS15G0140500 [Xanthoceras sorbifolium]